ncbi:TPR_REGION domain-containing protein [Caenorhabditis elegans]|uniref:TPR_REGION domain-containing protein n=1 Tax=Caenorhabditis elegans TaxID=6239 RepID=O16656_CAEEL|nr:TPR_REGION domain-containing protein [Caenorhabditis elegans]CCD62821.2 TPR_REGION domain-containing protein [Caenorhabditis elegans]|eukprot:NP_493721.2 Uncharacterized protein CELE_C03H5.5 [Caenorhabditis elegans]
MIVETKTNRLHQKIKKLKEDLAREKELRKEAERQLKVLLDKQTGSLEITKPENIGLFITPEPQTSRRPIKDNSAKPANSKTMSELPTPNEDTKATDIVLEYLAHFSKMIAENNLLEIQNCYYDRLETVQKQLPPSFTWPDEITVRKSISPENQDFMVLYKELKYRRLNAEARQNKDMLENYQSIFSILPGKLNLPDYWILDIMEEYVFQIQTSIISTESVSNKDAALNTLISLASQPEANLKTLSLLGLIRMHIFLQDHQSTSQILDQMPPEIQGTETMIRVTYQIGFAYLIIGRFAESVDRFLKVLSSSVEQAEKFKINALPCIAYCISNSSKELEIPSEISKHVESTYPNQMKDWKEAKIETFLSFFAECSSFIPQLPRNNKLSLHWKSQNLKSMVFYLQRVTTWKPLRNLKGLLKICPVLPLEARATSLLPVSTSSDIDYFCQYDSFLNRLVTVKPSKLTKIFQDFPDANRQKTLVFLIMKYHKILQTVQKSAKIDEKIADFGRKFIGVLGKAHKNLKIDQEDAMCYMREVAKISMDDANRFVENHCSL